jgi:sugar/nucleoside kinase (ribokinase family)
VPGVQPNTLTDRLAVVIAGHICVDIIPSVTEGLPQRTPRPGALERLGPVALAVGGCVGNTGITLHRLGLPTSLVGRVGDDRLGDVLTGLVHDAVPGQAAHLIVTPGELTSYSLIWNRPGEDRAIQHFPGVNDAFVADDVPPELLSGAALLHVGYPPLMAAMIANDGRELRRLLVRARAFGLLRSIDMASVGRGRGGDRVRWRSLLQRVLPEVEVFLPSLAEAGYMLRRRAHRTTADAGTLDLAARLANDLIGLGVAIAGIKLGENGLYVRTASAARLAAAAGRLAPSWANRELYSSVFETRVVGTTGAGDSTIAGFLFGLLTARSPDDSVTIACAVGGASTEAADGTSGVPAWPQIERRLRAGWRRRSTPPGVDWTPSRQLGLWYGPRDALRSDG